jgi:class 3 adenylate cyclase/tetratricopeptide (TPR) repeat protein
MLVCAACGSDNPPGARFCDECGVPLQKTCPDCGAPVREGKRFCAQCGTALGVQHAPGVPEDQRTSGAENDRPPDGSTGLTGAPELRRVSVLFVDLVGYTSLTESWDPEDVRELLSGYFDAARTVVGRYGGAVEKFIGDAVMAVWGAPVAQGDDAERAVRAALEIVEAVTVYGEQRGVPGLSARAGVVTGQVASWASPGEGLVTGDRVNTAARVQSTAEPGSVYVDEATWSATQAAIAYVATGEHRVKGKSEPLRLWHAVRVVSNLGGTQRVDGLEAGFVGRARELALVKELFHATVEGSRARLVLISGAAGVGKSRLGWEFEKYIDGLAATVLWHRGRCLSYGEGVAFWALAEMVRQRFDIAEEEQADSARAKLSAELPTWVADPSERDFVAPRLGVLVGAVDAELSREELFAGWRLFLERMAATSPVVLLIEDLHWADAGMLDFLEYLLDWSANSPIFVLAFARPELTERRPGWVADRRNATLVHLDPLPPPAMDSLLDGLVPNMPDTAKARIAERAAGIPLYAVETVRTLVDRDLVVPREGVYVLTGDIGELEVPGTLASLLAARLDSLPVPERTLVKALSVLGDSFTVGAASAVGDARPEDLRDLLRTLVRKEILTVRDDPLSPERGQYVFVQSMLRAVAYDMLTKRERKARHLAAAQHLRRSFPDDGDEVAEVIAAHYLDAYKAMPTDADGDAMRAEAAAAFERAGRRAGTLGSPDQAEKAYRTAATLAVSEAESTRLTVEAASMAVQAGRFADALAMFEAATDAHNAAGRVREAALYADQTGHALSALGRAEEATRRMLHALDVLGPDASEPAVARLHAALGTALELIGGHDAEAEAHIELALQIATALELPDVLTQALMWKAFLLADLNRMAEAFALMKAAVDVAADHGLVTKEDLAHANLAELKVQSDSPGAAEEFEVALTFASRLGNGHSRAFNLMNLAAVRFQAGNWDEAERLVNQSLEAAPSDHIRAFARGWLVVLLATRGHFDEAADQLAAMGTLRNSDIAQDRVVLAIARAYVAMAEDRPDAALAVAREACGAEPNFRTEGFRWGWPLALEAAIRTERSDEIKALLALVAEAPKGHVPPYLQAQLAHYRALYNATEGRHETVEADLRSAIEILAKLGYPYWLARTQADLARWLMTMQRAGEADPLLADVVEVFTRLGAQPDLDRARALMSIVASSAADQPVTP